MTNRADDPQLGFSEEEPLEQLDSQVQRAHEQLLQLKRQQEQIERQKRELEELSRRQEQFQQGKAEMVEAFTRALVVLEREVFDAQKRVEQLKNIQESFSQHLATLEDLNPKNWDNTDISRELTRALSAVDDAHAEYDRSRVLISAEPATEPLAPVLASGGAPAVGPISPNGFTHWLTAGAAFTMPLILVVICLFALWLAWQGR
jgi:hypothetical protein